MIFNKTKAGFSIIELVIILVVVGLVGFVGYTAYQKLHSTSVADTTTAQSPVATDVKPMPVIATSSDLTPAETTLDQTDTTSADDLNSLDRQLDF